MYTLCYDSVRFLQYMVFVLAKVFYLRLSGLNEGITDRHVWWPSVCARYFLLVYACMYDRPGGGCLTLVCMLRYALVFSAPLPFHIFCRQSACFVVPVS